MKKFFNKEKNIKQEDTNMYNSLAPKVSDEVDKDNVYCRSLKWALENDTIKNIAITGIYGAGKSSIIEKFINSYNKYYSFFNVSLASFNNITSDTNDIEKCILQQIFYQVDAKYIPHSRFKKIKHTSSKKLIFAEFVFWLFSIMTILTFAPNYISLAKLISNIHSYGISYTFSWFMFIIFICTFLYVMHQIIKFLMQRIKLTKFSFSKVGFEVDKKDENSEKSIFNKYMDEIIYFFEATSYNVFIFEDLDRFDNPEIFIKLRELNIILNNYEKIKRKIVFVYAIKDDIFNDKERTKFFEFIIPVIPFLNSSNSFEILDNRISSLNIPDVDIKESYLLDISPFINDMRLLDNIMNEFKLYKLKLFDSKMNDEELFSIIIYKNMCPKDFALLQNNKGLIYEAFQSKNQLISSMLAKIKKELDIIDNQISEIHTSCLSNLTDIKYQLIGLLQSKTSYYIKPSTIRLKFNQTSLSIDEFLDSKEINYLSIQNLIIEYNYMKSNYSGTYSESLHADSDILKFIKDLSDKKERIFQQSQIRKLNDKKSNLLNEKTNLEIKTYAELLETIEPVYDETYKDEQYDIAKFMLRRGYIDETFPNYISYFHEGNLTVSENNFILSLKNNQSLGYTYELNNLQLLLTKLDKRDLKNSCFYNVYLLNYLLENKGKNDEHFKVLFDTAFETLCNSTNKNKEFIYTFTKFYYEKCSLEEYTVKLSNLSYIMCNNWDDAFSFLFMILQDHLNEKHREILLHEALKRLSINVLKLQNKNNFIVQVIQTYPSFLELANDIINIKEIIKHLDIEFKHLIISEKCSLSDYIFEQDYFEFNTNYIENVQKLYFQTCSDFFTKNFTLINEANKNGIFDWLINKIHSNITEYIRYLINLHCNINDSWEYVLELLNIDNLPKNLKKDLIHIENIMIPAWDESLDKSLWSDFLSENKINATWENISEYFDNFEYDEKLQQFISDNRNNLKDMILDSHDLAVCLINDMDFIDIFLQGNVFNSQIFDYNEVSKLDKKSFELLINKDLYDYTVDNFNEISNNTPSLCPFFLKKAYEKDDFELEECLFNDKNILSIFTSNLKFEIKKSIIQMIVLEDFNLQSLQPIAYFISDYCDIDDIDVLTLKNLITLLDDKTAIHLINSKSSSLTNQELISLLQAHQTLKLLLIYRKQPKFIINDETSTFLQTLCDRNVISSYIKKANNFIAYTKKNN